MAEPIRWDVRDGFANHEIRVEINEQSGRALVRLDGRIVAPPFETDHDEREFNVGATRYRVMRMGADHFEMEIVPIAVNATSHRSSSRPAKGPDLSVARWPGVVLKIVVAAVVIAFIAGIAQMAEAYFTPWELYEAPDQAYKVRLPARPETSRAGAMNIAEVMTDDCLYYIGSQKLDRQNYKYNDHKMLDDMIKRWSRDGAEILSAESLNNMSMVAGRSVMLNYKGEVDGKQVDSTMRILAASTYNHVVIVIAEYPRGARSQRMKVDRFFRSISLGT